MGPGIKRVVFLPCVFTVHAVHSACILNAIRRSQDHYSCPVCRSFPSRSPDRDSAQVMQSLFPLVQDEFLSNMGFTEQANLTLVNAGGSNRNGQPVFVEKWLDATVMRFWERVVPMPLLPLPVPTQAAALGPSNIGPLSITNQGHRPSQVLYIDPNMGNPALTSAGSSSGQAVLDSSNAQLPETSATATTSADGPRSLTGSDIDALVEGMPGDLLDSEMVDAEVGDTIVVEPRE